MWSKTGAKPRKAVEIMDATQTESLNRPDNSTALRADGEAIPDVTTQPLGRRAETPPSPAQARSPADFPEKRPEKADANPQGADNAPDPQKHAQADAPANPARNRLRLVLLSGGVIVTIGLAFGFWLSGGRYVSTDNSYVRASKLMVSTDVSGIVDSVEVREGQAVKAGQNLFQLDQRQYQIALQMAKAQLELTKSTLLASRVDYQRMLTEIEAQSAQVDLAKSTNDRAATLLQSNAGTRVTYDQARFAFVAATKQLESLRDQAKAALVRLGGSLDVPVESLPQYLDAKSRADEAQRQMDHTIVKAPFDGIVTAVDHLQPGTYLVSQTAALTNTGAVGLVSTSDMWVDANFKETDLTYVRKGNPVKLTVDAFPGREWRGKVSSISPASGAEFSILPAQNASGNWVKVVQRVPVRISFEPEPDAPALRSGMSVTAEIDTGHKRKLSELWSGDPAVRGEPK